MASTLSPTLSEESLARVIGVSPETSAALMTARSEPGSRPTIVADAFLPSLKLTVMVPAPSAADSITWLFVTMVPSERRTTPEPSPPPWAVETSIATTLGWTAAATLARVSVGVVPPSTLTGEAMVRPPASLDRSARVAPVAPAARATAATTPRAPARLAHTRPLPELPLSVGTPPSP